MWCVGDNSFSHCVGFLPPLLQKELAFKGLLPQSWGNMAVGTLGSFPLPSPPLPKQPIIFCLFSVLCLGLLCLSRSYWGRVSAGHVRNGLWVLQFGSVNLDIEWETFYQSQLQNCFLGACASNAIDNDCPLGSDSCCGASLLELQLLPNIRAPALTALVGFGKEGLFPGKEGTGRTFQADASHREKPGNRVPRKTKEGKPQDPFRKDGNW